MAIAGFDAAFAPVATLLVLPLLAIFVNAWYALGLVVDFPVVAIPVLVGAWRLPIIAVSASIMLLVIATGEVLLHLAGVRPTPTPPPIEAALPVELPPGRDERPSRPTQGVPAGRP